MTQAELARQLSLSVGYVCKLVKAGMPVDLDGARSFLDLKRAGRLRKLPPVANPSAVPATQAQPVQAGGVIRSLVADSLTDAIRQHRGLVNRAREVYLAAIEGNDPAQGKLQSAYNSSLKTLISLEDEEKRRALEAREYIRLTEHNAIVSRLAAELVARLDKLSLDCAEGCNPDRPEVAVKVLDRWTLQVRRELSSD
jgi:hypothetical protein